MVAKSRITLLADNTAAPGLHALHGFSALVETAAGRLLFDTGPSAGALEANARILGRRLDGLDAIVLSHGHYDHTGALAFVLALNPLARLYLHPAALQPRYSRRRPGAPVRSIGMPAVCVRAVEAHGPDVHWTHRPTPALPGMTCTGPIPRIHESGPAEPVFFLDPAARIPDPLIDDQAVTLDWAGGAVALLGCTHSGLANTLAAIRSIAGPRRLGAIIGGLHTGGASLDEYDSAARLLLESGASIVAACHCTGASALDHFSQALSPHIATAPAGVGWTWEAA